MHAKNKLIALIIISAGLFTVFSSQVLAAPIRIPGRIEMEAYRAGANGVTYYDTTPGNSGGQYPVNPGGDVDITRNLQTGGYFVGWLAENEWLTYDIDVPTSGNYDITVRVTSSVSERKTFHIEVDGLDITGPIYYYDASNNWNNVVVSNIALSAGNHILKFYIDESDYFDVDYIQIDTPPTIPDNGQGWITNFRVSSANSSPWTGDALYLRKMLPVSQINITNLDILYAGRRKSSLPHYGESVSFHSQVYFPVAGNYCFRLEAGSNTYWTLYSGLENSRGWGIWTEGSGNSGDRCSGRTNQGDSYSFYYDQGWYEVRIYFGVYGNEETPAAKLYWRRPGSSSYELIPSENLNYHLVPEDELIIPQPPQLPVQLNFVTSGIGWEEILENNQAPEVKINVPVTDERQILKEDVVIHWFDGNSQITVTNGGVTRTVTGRRLRSIVYEYPVYYAKLPSELITLDGNRILNLKFSGIESGANYEVNGLGIIVPYVDPARPLGRLYLGMPHIDLYGGAISPINFNLENILDNNKNDMRSLFFFFNGETKETIEQSPPRYRPNFLAMLTGTGQQPREFDLLNDMNGGKIIVPSTGPIDKNNPYTWYPAYGRMGPQFDVVASNGNYKPNLYNMSLENNDGGVIQNIDATGKKWISFQYVSSNLDLDGVGGSNESGGITLFGLLISEPGSLPKLMICPNSNLTLNINQSISLTAKYWARWNGTDDCSADCSIHGTCEDVTVDNNTTWYPPTIISGIKNSGTNKYDVTGTNAGYGEINVTYVNPDGLSIVDRASIVVTNTVASCSYNKCDASTGYVCQTQTLSQSICPIDNCLNIGETCDTGSTRSWIEVRP